VQIQHGKVIGGALLVGLLRQAQRTLRGLPIANQMTGRALLSVEA
jgi:hypothetical protein